MALGNYFWRAAENAKLRAAECAAFMRRKEIAAAQQ
jgi:hypothetical protein